ncbi:serine hydrolase [Blastomonas marina]|jgi:CubicO group peptidase (beta-lactamase class C family)|uniref:serine hydrolase domain-containing protein n=1 Tax=Blastomonas marina TaxID=1867408 RepID=UPI002AC90E8B|nr:serine hydrolase [Blastomonas marina]WPZ03408.1 serine hydrolase [Blastomonas marina]
MSSRLISTRPTLSIAALALAPVLLLAGCSGDGEYDPETAPLSEEAQAAIAPQVSVSRDALARRVEALFAEDVAETRAVIVVHEGEIAAERYAPGYDAETRFVSWSMAKTVTGVLIGLLVTDGLLSLDESAPVPAWTRPGDPRGEITLRQLLQMRSGLTHTEAGDPVYESDEVRMLFTDGRDDMAAHAEAQSLEANPGEKFEYSSNTTVILADIAARTLATADTPEARRRAVDDYLRSRLFEPLGMDSIVPEYDAAGTLIGGSLMHATARDWAKFGEFLRQGGQVEGVQVVPRRWIEFMTTPSPRSPDYGAQTWLNRPSGTDRQSLFPNDAPQSAFAMIGHLGQYVFVSPSQELTIVRLGKTQDGELRNGVVRRIARLAQLFQD